MRDLQVVDVLQRRRNLVHEGRRISLRILATGGHTLEDFAAAHQLEDERPAAVELK